MKSGASRGRGGEGRGGPAADPKEPYARLAVVGLIGRDNGSWLLLRRRDPAETWDPPGGRMERGEDLTTAVIREVAEETGLAVQVAGPCYACLTVYKGERLLAISMACRPMGDNESLKLEADGATEWRWADSEEWERLAAEGRSSWEPRDVKRATRMATILGEMQKE